MNPATDRLETIPLDLARWGLTAAQATRVEYQGRDCLRFAEGVLSPTALGVELADGILEADLVVRGSPRAGQVDRP